MTSRPGLQIKNRPHAVSVRTLLTTCQKPLNHGTQDLFINNSKLRQRGCTAKLLPEHACVPVYQRWVKTSGFHFTLPLKTETWEPASDRAANQPLASPILHQKKRR